MVGDPLQAVWVCWLVAAVPHEGGELRHRHRPARQVVAGQVHFVLRQFIVVCLPVTPLVAAHLERTGGNFDEAEQRFGGQMPMLGIEARIAQGGEVVAGQGPFGGG